MANAFFEIREPKNEPPYSYSPGSLERKKLKAELERLANTVMEIPAIINGKEIKTNHTIDVVMPHDHQHKLAKLYLCGAQEVEQAIEASIEASKKWAKIPWEQRVAVFEKAADLLSGSYHYTLNAASMLGQSKNPYESEIDAIAEVIDFFRFNVYYLTQIYKGQPNSPEGTWNRTEYRPLEGFVFAVTPFNFTSIGANLPTAPVICGNVSLWKPATSSAYSNYFLMKILMEAGLPDGVINFLPGRGADIGDPVLKSKHMAGLHFTGSTKTFHHLWKEIASNIETYYTYPRVVGETGGKDFIFAHPSAQVRALAIGALRGAYGYQGQKCSAASRAYVPISIWPEFKEIFTEEVAKIKIGDVQNFENYMGAVIDKTAFDKISKFIEYAKSSDEAEIVIGGEYDDTVGYFIKPTLIKTVNPRFRTMEEEIFGPVLTVYVYDDADFEQALEFCNTTSPYGLTGSIFAQDRYAINFMVEYLTQAAGNFYINDKPTAAVVNQQPFGGARKSGTNDKAGSAANLIRWLSNRSIKETTDPPKNWDRPFMGKE